MPVGPPPAAVTSLSVQPGDGINTVQWPAIQTATSYDLYWSETSPVTTSSAVIKGAVSPFVHDGRTNGKLVYYAVVALNEWGASALSIEVGAMPVAPVPAAPTTLNATRETPASPCHGLRFRGPTRTTCTGEDGGGGAGRGRCDEDLEHPGHQLYAGGPDESRHLLLRRHRGQHRR